MYNDTIKKLSENGRVTKRILKNDFGTVYVFYIKQLTNTDILTESVLIPLMNFWNYKNERVTPEIAAEKIICPEELEISSDEKRIEEEVLSGMTVMIFEGYFKYLILDVKKIDTASSSEPELNYSIWGAKDSFTENMNTNLSLLQYRIKDPSLKIDKIKIGKRTKSMAIVAYISEIANPEYTEAIKNRLKNIDVDGICEAGKLSWYLKDSPFSLFPQCGLEQRADSAAEALLEGKIAVILEGNPVALILPKVFIEFFRTDEDETNNFLFGFISKLLRLLSCFIALMASPAYIALTAFCANALPTHYIMSIASSRAGVPFSVVSEIVIMEILVEILRECLMKIPKNAGTAIGIVGGIVIGSAAVEAGLISSGVLVIVALSLMCSFAVSDYAFTNTIRTFKPIFIVLSALFGISGLAFSLAIFFFGAIRLSSVSVPYMAPYSPLRPREAIKGIYTTDLFSYFRPSYLRTKNRKRQK